MQLNSFKIQENKMTFNNQQLFYNIFNCLMRESHNYADDKQERNTDELNQLFNEIYLRNTIDIKTYLKKHEKCAIKRDYNGNSRGEACSSTYQVFIRISESKTIALDVTSTDTVLNIKEQIQSKQMIPLTEQRLIYGSRQLEDNFRLSYYNIRKESTLHLASKLRGGSTQIYINKPNGELITLAVNLNQNETIESIKNRIQDLEGIPLVQQILVFSQKQLNNNHTLAHYCIKESSTLHLLFNINSTFKFVDDSMLDPRFDYDFTNIDDNDKIFYRGNEVYERPCGWKRIALNVKNKYSDKKWLGKQNCDGEWPVVYHGTNLDGIKGICLNGFDITKLKRFAYGKGHYTTPIVSIAELYAQKLMFDNFTLVFIIQSRVDPKKLIKRNDNKYWIVPESEDLRPYGVCYKISNIS